MKPTQNANRIVNPVAVGIDGNIVEAVRIMYELGLLSSVYYYDADGEQQVDMKPSAWKAIEDGGLTLSFLDAQGDDITVEFPVY